MTRMRKFQATLSAVIAALLLVAAPAAAQDAAAGTANDATQDAAPAPVQEIAPDQLKLARQYVDLTDSSKIFEVTLVQTGIDTMKTLLAQNPDLEKQLNAAIGDTIKSLKVEKDDLMNQFARIYAIHFTKEELQTIVDFYSSDVGQKLVKENFDANPQIRRILGVFKNNLNTEFLAKVRANLKQQGIDL